MNKVEIKSDTTMTGTWRDFPPRTLVIIGGGNSISHKHAGTDGAEDGVCFFGD